ncbi:DAK2 domain-containing protein [Corynebacterium propinquum]|uniref:DAK2 domain-containing protein n=1 Tax=Corynebacterium propinquum TaxID=43769 RepID=UPI000374E104|nr:DAK2 domain-containing protein [Corynebacterium propinquum]MDK4233825.1 DAK2 domain-containing protein [Corynebacterium propinquum]MDK4258674.1 DAK2 domain-containing protein [Corynebacterium propinquum]MDK4281509.1 DAK2 domain-containing protein [Corynebacterium propinquum]MDK4292279.1 DAK2 domain-containing protein [Corynebacterium propinquum]QQU90606.1 DAK2 domain-containing protein [Corynebacterium propinquum]
MSLRPDTLADATAPATRLDGAGLRRWAQRAATELQRRRSEINGLNVYPVPDSDTGSNMSFTMDSALAQASETPDNHVATALAMGAARGARGNSGVILSQVLRGIADSCPDSCLEAPQLRSALHSAVELSEKAIVSPVEGTIISVLRACAQAVDPTAETEATETDLLTTACDALHAGEQALAATPSQLPELRAAGVVDAGGVGLLVLLQTLVDELEGRTEPHASALATDTFVSHADQNRSHHLEVMFFFTGDVDQLEAGIAPLGDSLIIARVNDTEATVHIHSHRAGAVIEESLEHGRPSDIRLEVLPDAQADAQADNLSAASAHGDGAHREDGTGATGNAMDTATDDDDDDGTAARTKPRTKPQTKPRTKRRTEHRQLVALVDDSKIAELFAQAGAHVAAPQEFVEQYRGVLGSAKTTATNTSHTGAATATAPVNLSELTVLSNGYTNAQQHQRWRSQGAEVIETASLCAGIAAISVYDKTLPAAEATETMCEAAHAMRTAIIENPTEFGDQLGPEVLRVASNLVGDDIEQITILTPFPAAIDAEALAKLGVEVIVFATETGPIELGVE